MHTTQEGWRDAAVHAIGEGGLYRPTSSLTEDVLFTRVYRLATARAENPPPATRFYTEMWEDFELRRAGVSMTARNELSRYLSKVDDMIAASPQVAARIREALQPLIEQGLATRTGSGAWHLTLSGIEQAVSLRPFYSTKSVTSFWFERKIDLEYMGRLKSALSQRCVRSSHFGEIDDLIHNYVSGIIRRDAFRNRIASGRHPAFSDIKQWIYNLALSTWRNEGRDAQTRAFKGSRTEKDLAQEDDADIAERSVATEAQGIFLVTDGDGDIGSMASSGSLPMPLLDVLGGNFEDEMLHRLTWQRGMERASAVVRRVKQGAPERYDRLLRDVVEEGAECKDISAQEGVSRNRAATLMASLRTTMSGEREVADLAVRVFAYLKDNPYSTVSDMEAPENEDPEAMDGGLGVRIPSGLLDALETAGRVSSHGVGARRSFLLTDKGAAAMSAGDYFGVDLCIHRPSRGSGASIGM